MLVLVIACGGASSDTTGDGASSSDDSGPSSQTSSDDTTPSTADDDSTSSPATSEGSSSETSSEDEDTTTVASTESSDTAADESTGNNMMDCTNEKNPCELELDVTVAGQGGADQFFVYTVGDGAEHVTLSAIAGDYAAWGADPWTFACLLDGPCCMSDGVTPCDELLVQPPVELDPGDTAYVLVYANAPYELTITSP